MKQRYFAELDSTNEKTAMKAVSISEALIYIS